MKHFILKSLKISLVISLVFLFNFFGLANEKKDNPEVIALEEAINYKFIPNKNKLEVFENSYTVFESQEEGVEFVKVDFFDDESQINSTTVKDGRGKKMKISPTQQQYSVESYFYSDANISYLEMPFYYQGKELSVAVEKQYFDVRYFTRVNFFTYYPVNNKKISFEIPEGVNLELVEYNFDEFDIDKTEETIKGVRTITYNIENLSENLGERRSNGGLTNLPHILVVPKSFESSGEVYTVFESTKDLYKWYKDIVNLVKDDTEIIKDVTNKIIKDATSDEEKIKTLFYWVQDNIRYIAFEDGIAGFKPDEAQSVYEKKYGDCKGMANLLKQMLIQAGFDARISWIGTNRLPYSYSTPSLGVDNHMITTLFYNDEIIYLDPTDEYSPFKEIGFHIQNKEILIENGEEFFVKKVPVIDLTHNTTETKIEYTLSDELELTGKASQTYNGLSRSFLLYLLNSIDQSNLDDAVEYYLNDGNKNISVKEITTGNIKEKEGVFEINYDITVKNSASKFGNEVYLNIDLEKEFSGMEIEEERLTDYVFPHQINTVVDINLNIPSGFEISYLPEPVEIIEEEFSISTNFIVEDDKLIYRKNIQIINGIIPTKAITRWNKAIASLEEFYEDSVILKTN